eukprot:TRINITY_DN10899_c0_g1_i5.p1 TRINITY_DN10899_c0_g1~~TRINITY_DN10899_c0_g1_i5.p1  ORF type:complete len:698 (+),score=171.70 TRINITY_DN10899_c0_g1_i5:15-2108(+)
MVAAFVCWHSSAVGTQQNPNGRRPPVTKMVEYEDVFGLLQEAAQDLKPGELLTSEDFTLFQALSALEMLDPRMDTGAVQLEYNTILAFEQAKAEGLQLKSFTPQQLAFIMSNLIKQVGLWLRGNSLSETVLTCVLLHNVTDIEHPLLKVFCTSVMKTIDQLRAIAYQTQVHFEEDLSLKADEADLVSTASMGKVISSQAHACTQLQRQADDYGEWYASINNSMSVLTSMMELIKAAQTATAASSVQEHLNALVDNLTSLQSVPDPEDWKTAGPFRPYMNLHRLPCGPNRHLESLSFDETKAYLLSEVQRVLDHVAVLSSTTSEQLLARLDHFRHVPGRILSNMLMAQLLQPTADVFGLVSPNKLMMASVADFDGAWMLEPGVKLNPEASSALNDFLDLAFDHLKQRAQFYCMNPGRYRRKLAKFLLGLRMLYQKALAADVLCESRCETKPDAKVKTNPLAVFATLLSGRACVDYIMSGLELQLHGQGEYIMVYWYLTYMTGWVVRCYNHGFQGLSARREAIMAQPKKKGKAKKKKVPKPPIASPMWHIHDCIYSLARGTVAMLRAAKSTGRFHPPTSKYRSEQSVFNRRFGPFGQVEAPPIAYYADYQKETALKDDMKPAELFSLAEKAFKAALQSIAALEAMQPAPVVPYGYRLEAWTKVAKTNLVSSKIAAMGRFQHDQVVFHFDVDGVFPIIKV